MYFFLEENQEIKKENKELKGRFENVDFLKKLEEVFSMKSSLSHIV